MAKSKLQDLADKDKEAKSSMDSTLEFNYEGQSYGDSVANLELSNLTPEEVRVALNRAPAKYAYWGGFHASVNTKIDEQKADMDVWFAKKYSEVAREDPKATETAKKNYIMLAYNVEYSERLNNIRALELARDKVSVLVKAYEMQSRTLQSIAGLMRAELEHITQ